MTLGRRMAYKTMANITSIVLLAVASVWGLNGLRDGARIARDEYLELRMIQSVERRLAPIKGMLSRGGALDPAVAGDIRDARGTLDEFLAFQTRQRGADPADQARERAAAEFAQGDLSNLLDHLDASKDHLMDPPDGREDIVLVDHILRRLDLLAGQMDTLIAATHQGSSRKLWATMVVLAVLSITTVVAAIMLNVSQYRSVVSPLSRLRDGVRKLGLADFSQRLAFAGDREFTEFADEFNRIAAQLDTLYRELEARIQTTSRELVRSERLASVGFLAAGVAHEINNPLNIISAYAELTLKHLRDPNGPENRDEWREALGIIRDESFRCKEIIEKLLSLSMTGEKARARVSVAEIAADVAMMVSGLKKYRDRQVILDLDDSEDLLVLGSETELKQVLLNLTVNAIEAVKPGIGKVHVDVHRENEWVQVRVTDNGLGMPPKTVEQVFEPFFTTRRDPSGRGVGLGLAITHSIVRDHGGRITARSDGPDRGSCFAVQLPAFEENKSRGREAR